MCPYPFSWLVVRIVPAVDEIVSVRITRIELEIASELRILTFHALDGLVCHIFAIYRIRSYFMADSSILRISS